LSHRNFEVNQFLRKSRNRVVEAETVFSNLIRSEDKIPLTLFLAAEQRHFLAGCLSGAEDGVIDYEFPPSVLQAR
jgi:hypothetical protein